MYELLEICGAIFCFIIAFLIIFIIVKTDTKDGKDK